MVYGLWLSASGLQANQYRQDLIANNLANVQTTGFKHDLAVFSERRVASEEALGGSTLSDRLLDRMTGGLFVAPTFTQFDQGAIQKTNRPLDVALDGEGFFAVQDAGRTAYTRDGRFTVNRDGQLVTVAGGRPVLSDAGTAIRVSPDRADDVRVAEDGSVRVGAVPVAKLGVADFADKQELQKVGANLFVAPAGAVGQEPAATVHSGALESSTVDPASAMVAMIEASRAYEMNATMVRMQDSMLDKAANSIAKLA